MRASSRPAVVVTLVLLFTSVLAGCIGGDDGDGGGDPEINTTTNDNETNLTNPEGFEESAGFKETNKTEEGVGGNRHTHDYWDGQTSKVVFDDSVYFFPMPLFPDGEGTSAKSVSFLKLPKPNLVYEGTGRVEVVVGTPEDVFTGSPNPVPPSIQLQWRTAASAEWTDPVDVQFDTPIEIPVDRLETDMPHSVQSLWAWRITTDRPDWETLPVQVTVYKDREVEDWPGHPEFYADGPIRKIMNEEVSTHIYGLQDGTMYDQSSSWVNPPLLISHGTTRLHVFINVSHVENAYGADATGIFLEHHNATMLGEEIEFGERTSDEDGSADGTSWDFFVDVDHDGMDGPYQPSSRWGFRAMATFANAAGFGFCPGCFDYDIQYHIDILAINDEWEPPVEDEETEA